MAAHRVAVARGSVLLGALAGLLLSAGTPMAQTPSPVILNPGQGGTVGMVFETWMSPHQQGGEEDEVPALTPPQFRSTGPSVPRAERRSRGHALLRVSRDQSQAWLDLAIDGIDPAQVVMLHLHCGRPGMLGPILVDLGIGRDLPAELADGRLSARIVNVDLLAAAAHGHGIVGAFTAGCPILPANPHDRVRTIAGLTRIALDGDLYLNLHTAGQTYFGDIRGQFHPPLR